MRVGILSIQHESNTFIRDRTSLEHFRQDRLLVGEAVRSQATAHHEVGGFFQGLGDSGVEVVPLLMAVATPGGIVENAAVEALSAIMFEQLAAAGPLDGLLVAPHGAGVGELHRDLDGYWLTLLRERVGRSMPVVATLDLHANLSSKMVRACDAIIGYRTNPHLDQRQRGIDAARLMARTIRGEVRPTMAAAFPELVINIERQSISEVPCRDLYAFADAQLGNDKVLSNTVLLGFPYADVEEMGASAIVVTNDDAALADQLAREIGDYLIRHREDFQAQLIGPAQAVEMARQSRPPVCLLDMGDNVGGGSAGDGTELARFLLDHAPNLRSFVAIYDPQAVQSCLGVAPGSSLRLNIGAKTDEQHGEAIEAEVRVLSVHCGRFTESLPRHGGRIQYEMGPTVIAQTGRLTLQLTSRRVLPFSLAQITSCNLDPKDFDILIAKGVHAPRAAYETVCSRCIRVDTRGSTQADYRRFHYDFAPAVRCS
jgi:microcystin degradation protein MlrC